ncbi:MAG TPA: hypothetical protein VHT26_06385 [Trebonia sp.]|nr:hypothetical protein [Trebonia sp.]
MSDGAGVPAAAVVTIHAVIDAVEAELPLGEEPVVVVVLGLLELPLLHAAAPVATAAASATAASVRLLLRIVDS